MSSVGQAVGGFVGGVVGFIVGGPTGALYGAQIGLTAGGLIDPPKGPKLQGPRLSDLSQQSSTYGVPIPRVYGTVALYGNIIWLKGDSLTEVSTTTSSDGKGGGGGATTTTYAYFATFAVALCRGPIDGVLRVWVGPKLIYDATAVDVGGAIASNANKYFTLYTGTETQEPDPLIQADKGVNNTPAYRGIAYMVFEDYPLEGHGNSLLGAQVKVEVVSSGSSNIATIIKEEYLPAGTLMHAPSYFRPLTKDVANKPIAIVQAREGGGGFDDWKTMTFTAFGTDPKPVITPYPGGRYSSNGSGEGDFTTRLYSNNHQTVYIDGVAYVTGLPVVGSTYYCETIVTEDAIWTYAKNTSTSNHYVTAVRKTLAAGGTGGYAMLVLEQGSGTSGEGHIAYDAETNQVLILRDDHFDKYDATTADLLGTVYFSSPLSSFYGSSFSVTDGVLQRVWHSSTYNALAQYDLSSGALIQNIDLPSYGGSGAVYGWVSGNILVRMSDTGTSATARRISLIKLPTIDAAGLATLSDIVEAECLQSGMLSGLDLDASALTDSVRGYRVASVGAIRAALLPLQSAWPFDIVQSGYQLVFVPRGGTSVASITADELGASAAGIAAAFRLSRDMDTQLPRRVVLNFLDPDREYETGTQYAERLNTDAVNVLDSELPLVLTAAEGAQKAEILLYMYWMERVDIGPLLLPPAYNHLEPADVITITTADGAVHSVRLTTINYKSDGVIECHGKPSAAAVYTSSALGVSGESTGGGVSYPGPTLYAAMDIPALRDQDDTPGFALAMCGYLSSWVGGVLYRSADGGATWSGVGVSTSPATMGYTLSAITSAASDVVDYKNALDIKLYAGTLASVSHLEMLNGANHFALGVDGRWEIIAAMTCVDNGDGTWTLKDLLRGRYGTEWATGLNALYDEIILLGTATIKAIAIDSSSIGLERQYRAITLQALIDTDTNRAFTYQGVNLKPLSPVYLNGNRHPTTNDWTLSWIRRTRIGGAWRDYIDAPVSETSEAYEVEIYSSGTYATLKRTLSVTATTATYTSAEQVADFGSNQSTLYVRVYQISSVVGRGIKLETSITR